MESPLGPIMIATDALRKLVAASATFRAWVGAADATEALESAHLAGLPKPAEPSGFTLIELMALRPLAVADLFVSEHRGYGAESVVATKNAFHSFLYSGKLTLDFVADVPDEMRDDHAASKVWFLNRVGLVVHEMAALSGTDGYLNVVQFELFQGPYRSDPEQHETAGDFWRVQYVCHWADV